jgi:protein dithiol:quinone oxidoreductase
MNPLTWSFRTLCLATATACFAAIGYALYVEHVMLMMPCPLCIFQRIAFLLAGLFFLMAGLHNPTGLALRRVYACLAGLAAFGGLLVAGRHVMLQLTPADQLPICSSMGLDYMLEAMPLTDVLMKVFKGSGECAKIDWQLFGLSMPMWTVLLYLGLIAIAFAAARKQTRI